MAGSSRPLVGLDKTKAFKVIAGHPNLSGATKAVAALIVDHFNIKTERCDPGLERLADKTGFTTRTVRRSLRALEAERLLKSLRHGGHNQTNAYQINWGLIRHLANQYESRVPNWWRCGREDNLVTPEGTIQSQIPDRNIHQNLEGNLEAKPPREGDKGLLIKDEGIQQPPSVLPISQAIRKRPSSGDVALMQAEKRWNDKLIKFYGKDYIAYGRAIDLITSDDIAAATAAELNCEGGGFRLIQQRISQTSSRTIHGA